MKLGKRPLHNDPRTLKLRNYFVGSALPVFPLEYNAGAALKTCDMLGNDTVGDCTIASAGHLTQAWNAAVGASFSLSGSQAVTQYSALGGYKPGNESTDNGLDPLVVLKQWRSNGLFGSTSGFWPFKRTVHATHRIGAFAAVSLPMIQQTVYLFGGAYIALELPDNYSQVEQWALPPDGKHPPNPANGHMVCSTRYDGQYIWIRTWGEEIPVHPAWLNLYGEEGGTFACISPDYLDPKSGKTPAGFDATALNADLQVITQ